MSFRNGQAKWSSAGGFPASERRCRLRAKLQWAENGDDWLVAQQRRMTGRSTQGDRPHGVDRVTRPPGASSTTPAKMRRKPVDMNVAPAEPVKRAEGNLATNIIGETVYNGGDNARR
jgi:hypothetical protein